MCLIKSCMWFGDILSYFTCENINLSSHKFTFLKANFINCHLKYCRGTVYCNVIKVDMWCNSNTDTNIHPLPLCVSREAQRSMHWYSHTGCTFPLREPYFAQRKAFDALFALCCCARAE